jgi:hypothetical protein
LIPSWPEPGVSSYLEVRQQTLDREREIASGVRVLGDRKRDLDDEDDEREEMQEGYTQPSVESESTPPRSWSKKIPKLIWRGVPMVEVRQVSGSICWLKLL